MPLEAPVMRAISLMSMSWGTVAGAFLGPYLYGLFWRRATRWGALAGLISGLVVSCSLYLVWGSSHSTEAGVLAMGSSVVVVPIVSLLTRPLPAQRTRLAFGEIVPDDGVGRTTEEVLA